MVDGVVQIEENIFSLAALRTCIAGSSCEGDLQYDFFCLPYFGVQCVPIVVIRFLAIVV